MKRPIIFILLSFLSISSSSKDNTLHKTQIIGSWIFIEDVANDTFFSIKKVKKLDHDKPGIVFKKNGKLIKRQNSGWCGTPPIAYANYDGTWELRKNTLSLKYSFNNGEMEEEWEAAAGRFKYCLNLCQNFHFQTVRFIMNTITFLKISQL